MKRQRDQSMSIWNNYVLLIVFGCMKATEGLKNWFEEEEISILFKCVKLVKSDSKDIYNTKDYI